MSLATPVALLIFNRPDTTARVFEAIRQARPKTLLVVADGPRPDKEGEAELCRQTRAVIEGVDWECQVLTNFSELNLGCKRRVASGISWIFEQVEEAIILEDDCLPHPSFFPFCEEMLERYRHDDRVSMIGGTNYLHDRLAIEESYTFSRYFAIWGWATWRRAWRQYDLEMRQWPALREAGQLTYMYPQEYMRRAVQAMFDHAHAGQINTWDIQWFYSCLFSNTVSIVPRLNLISNIGLVGTHTSGDTSNNNFPVFALDTDNLVHPEAIAPDVRYDFPFFEEQFKHTLIDKIRRRLARL